MSASQPIPNGPPPGSAEYLSQKLTGPDFSCPHWQKVRSGPGTKIPLRLGFFHVTDSDVSYLDTSKLCEPCYHSVVPKGFLCWSAYYRGSALNEFRSDHKYPQAEPAGTWSRTFPPQIQAGTEGFFKEPQHRPVTKPKAHEILGEIDYDGKHYLKRQVFLPTNDDTLAVWRFLQWARMPFYIDLLHLHPPYQNFSNKKQEKKEGERVAKANAAAYLGAAFVINAVPEGGSGPYSAAEQRLAQVGTYRLVPLGRYGSHVDSEVPDEGAIEGRGVGVTMWKNTGGNAMSNDLKLRRVAEVDPRWYPGQGAKAYRGGEFQYFPSKNRVDRVTQEAYGQNLPVDVDEGTRRRYERELPKEENYFLPAGQRGSSPPPDVQFQPTPAGFTDIERVGTWNDENSWKTIEGLATHQVGEGERRTTEGISRPREMPLFTEKMLKAKTRKEVNASGEIVELVSRGITTRGKPTLKVLKPFDPSKYTVAGISKVDSSWIPPPFQIGSPPQYMPIYRGKPFTVDFAFLEEEEEDIRPLFC